MAQLALKLGDLCRLVITLASLSPGLAAAASSSPTPVRLLLPRATTQLDAQFDLLVRDYNKLHPGTPAELLRRGEGFSSVRELMAMSLAGDLPDLAAIEPSELGVIPPALLKRSVPFELITPVLVVAEGNPFPKDWGDLEALAREHRLGLPLQGPRGLFILEALCSEPLWKREAGGLRSNHRLAPALERLRTMIGPVAQESTWDSLHQLFADRKISALVTTSDMLPVLTAQTTFHWKAGALPQSDGRASQLVGGNQLVLTKESSAAREFLDYLFSDPVAARWGRSLGPRHARQRATDPQLMRARSEWIQALHYLFGESIRRPPIEDILSQLDSRLGH
ncbi:MAG: hypothetical protein ACXWP5_02595 [Bdellovibrionota bacterium]